MKNRIIRIIIVAMVFVVVYQFGVKPIMSRDYYTESNRIDNAWARDKLTREKNIYDVIVLGEEPEGVAAAVSSSRTGARTILLCQGEDLGGSVCKGLYFDMEINTDTNGNMLSRGLFSEIFGGLGDKINVQSYKNALNKAVKGQKNLEVVYSVKLDSPVLKDNALTGINVISDNKKVLYNGKRFIDATKDGELLSSCKVPYFKGSEDIGLKKVFQPVKFNFVLSNVKWDKISAAMKPDKIDKFYIILKDFKPSNSNIRLGKVKFFQQDENKVVLQGIDVFGVDITDRKSISDAYNNSIEEAKRLVKFLKDRLIAFQDSEFEEAADGFYIKEYRHFLGEHVLSVNEALENMDFDNKIALASNAIETNILNDGYEKYIIGKPVQYTIPLGCLVPLKVDNLLMAGGKVSYSSLVSSSANGISVNMTTGESAGVAAVYSIVQDITPRELATKKDVERTNEFERLLKRQSIYLPAFKIKNPNTENWSYTSVRQLNSLGLIYAGVKNDYKFETETTQKDLAILLLNGIYRLSPDKYSLKLDARIRPYFVDNGLTKDKAAEILLALNGVSANGEGAFEKACKQGFINNAMALRLRDQKILTMDQIYELSAFNIMLFTGKRLQD